MLTEKIFNLETNQILCFNKTGVGAGSAGAKELPNWSIVLIRDSAEVGFGCEDHWCSQKRIL